MKRALGTVLSAKNSLVDLEEFNSNYWFPWKSTIYGLQIAPLNKQQTRLLYFEPEKRALCHTEIKSWSIRFFDTPNVHDFYYFYWCIMKFSTSSFYHDWPLILKGFVLIHLIYAWKMIHDNNLMSTKKTAEWEKKRSCLSDYRTERERLQVYIISGHLNAEFLMGVPSMCLTVFSRSFHSTLSSLVHWNVLEQREEKKRIVK